MKYCRINAKDLNIYAKPELGERCVMSCFEEYLGLIPSKGPLYRRAVASKIGCSKFSARVIGVHTLEKIVKEFAERLALKDTVPIIKER